jgi:hypothetical protein
MAGKHRRGANNPRPKSLLERLGISAREAEILMRVASLSLSLMERGFNGTDAMARALTSFENPREIINLGVRTWRAFTEGTEWIPTEQQHMPPTVSAWPSQRT